MNIRKHLTVAWVVLTPVLPAYAQMDTAAQAQAQVQAQPAQSPGVFSITPRVQLLLEDNNFGGASTSAFSNTATNLTSTPFYGATIGYTPPGSPYDALLTFLNSVGRDRISTISIGGPLEAGSVKGTRQDVELLGRRRLEAGENTYILFGARYIHLSFDTHLDSPFTFPDTGSSSRTSGADGVFLEGGLGTTGPLNQSHTLAYFGNLVIGSGYLGESLSSPKWRGDYGYLVDTSAGVSYRISNSVGVAFRYRALVAGSPAAINVAHGPELSLTYSW